MTQTQPTYEIPEHFSTQTRTVTWATPGQGDWDALAKLDQEALFLKVLGSWPEERTLPDPVSAG